VSYTSFQTWKLDCGKAGIKADSTALHNGEVRKAQEFSHRQKSLQIPGTFVNRKSARRNFRSFRGRGDGRF